ncbi:MAG TPA: site-specific DNA-methyltransferase, partial [Phycisphaerae bacterium]|nr:site-specific DNA-methyltransferase [Phycisphaerae bacterium]
MPTAQQLRERLVGLLTELFQLNQPDLDFGFWRIMHAKAREVTEFLRTDLLGIVAETFGRDSAARMAELQKAYEDAVAKAKEYAAPDPEQAEPVRHAKAALDAAADTSKAEGEVYDHLYRFFERYYADGDFLSRRYYARETPGKAAPYAVPYDGSEVCLHWANKDQYYVKTTEYFTNFTFDPTRAPEVLGAKDTLFAGKDLPPLKVEFRIVAATEGEHGNVKAAAEQKRFFILHEPEPVYFEDGRLVVGFEFRPDPEKTGQERTWQDKRAAEAVEKVLAALDDIAEGESDGERVDAQMAGRPVADLAREYAVVLRAPAPTEKEKNRPLLAKYVAQYVSRNTMDYFIHKDLGSFLRRELDFYLKNEVVRLDDIESADAPRAERYLDQVRVLRRIAHKIIAFL